ncbi:Bromodomain-containing protein [Fimicolochytrium jonesii]|uniref:Bromodomain-containing protein n=1 Tax=Fimicolochytrium jonesii TaxID=1396493 RepID=UPI0022FF3C04|nr:Bromodomain-containing protein [Fimicolochytrium jonesii]KAI8816398.1 Bromodomain-containing protein [Fimicolochytrium jonesii]
MTTGIETRKRSVSEISGDHEGDVRYNEWTDAKRPRSQGSEDNPQVENKVRSSQSMDSSESIYGTGIPSDAYDGTNFDQPVANYNQPDSNHDPLIWAKLGALHSQNATAGYAEEASTLHPDQLRSQPPPVTNGHDHSNHEPSVNQPGVKSEGVKSEGIPEDPNLVQEQLKFCGNVLKIVKRLKDAPPFLQPVDPVLLGIPNYLDVIKDPMDLSTIETKLRTSQYATYRGFVDDFKLMVENCYTFNGRESLVSQNALNLEKSFDKHMEKLPLQVQVKSEKQKKRPSTVDPAARYSLSGPSDTRPKREIHAPVKDISSSSLTGAKLSDPELKFCSEVLKELTKKTHNPHNWPFLQPVDPIALNIPHYPTIIKHPMDLSTMRKKLDGGEYASADEFEADMKLMLNNCYTFNPPGTDVHTSAQHLHEVFNRKWAEKGAAVAQAPRSDKRPAAKAKAKRQSVAQVQHEHEGEESSDEEDDDNTAKQLSLLNNQLQAITAQMAILQEKQSRKNAKKKASTSSLPTTTSSTAPKKQKSKSLSVPPQKKNPKKPPRPRAPKGSKAEENLPAMTYEQKEELSVLVGELSADEIDIVMGIIRAGSDLPESANLGGEVELDIELLSKSTLWKLYNFVTKKKTPTKKQTPAAKARPLTSSSRPMGLSRASDTSDGSDEGSESESD